MSSKAKNLLKAKEVSAVIVFMPLYLFLVVADGLLFYLFIRAFFPLPIGQLPLVVGVAASWRIISTFISKQIGVGELIYIFLLKGILPPPFFIIIPLFMRAWKILIEALMFLVLLLSMKFGFIIKHANRINTLK